MLHREPVQAGPAAPEMYRSQREGGPLMVLRSAVAVILRRQAAPPLRPPSLLRGVRLDAVSQ